MILEIKFETCEDFIKHMTLFYMILNLKDNIIN